MGKSEKKPKKLNIRMKLMMSFSILVLMIFLLGGAGVYCIYRINGNGSAIYGNELQSVDSLRQLSLNLREIDRDMLLLTTGTGDRDNSDYIYDIRVLQTQNGYLLNDYRQLMAESGGQYIRCKQNVDTYDQKVNTILEQLNDKEEHPDNSEALAFLEQEVLTLINIMTEHAIQLADEKNLENQHIFSTLIASVIIICLTAAAAATIIAYRISSSFTTRLETIRGLAKRIAVYDISGDIHDKSEDEIGKTITALNDSQFMLRDLLEKIVRETTDMSDMGADISDSLRKTGSRLQTVSMQIMQTGKMTDEMDQTISDVLAERKLDEDVAEQLRKLLPDSDQAREMLNKAMGEMNGITMHLEQIAVTSDYQNELARSHLKLITRFRLRQNPKEELPQPPAETRTETE